MTEAIQIKSKPLERFAWCLYDFANSSFPTVIITAVYVIYFKETVVGEGEPGRGDALWGAANSLGALVVFFLAPLLGAVADFQGLKQKFLQAFTLLCVLSTGALVLTVSGTVVTAMVLLILGITGFEAACVFYNAFLPELVEEKKMGRLSGNGWALGYLGGLGCLLSFFHLAQANMRLVPLGVAAWYLVFSLPSLILLRDRRRNSRKEAVGGSIAQGAKRSLAQGAKRSLAQGAKRLLSTVTEIRQHQNLVKFLLSYFFYNNAVLTIIVFAVAFARQSLRFTVSESVMLMVVMNVIAAPGAFFFGKWVDRIGAKKTLVITLLMWLLVVVGAELSAWPGLFSAGAAKSFFWLVAGFASLCIGAVQATSRTFVGQMAPEGRAAEFYGFMAFAGKGSAILGPLVFGAASDAFDSQRVAVLTIGVFFVVGLLLLMRVRDQSRENTGGG